MLWCCYIDLLHSLNHVWSSGRWGHHHPSLYLFPSPCPWSGPCACPCPCWRVFVSMAVRPAEKNRKIDELCLTIWQFAFDNSSARIVCAALVFLQTRKTVFFIKVWQHTVDILAQLSGSYCFTSCANTRVRTLLRALVQNTRVCKHTRVCTGTSARRKYERLHETAQ